MGLEVQGRIALSQLEELAPIQVELFFYIWPKGFLSFGVSAEKPAGMFYPRRDL